MENKGGSSAAERGDKSEQSTAFKRILIVGTKDSITDKGKTRTVR